MNVLCQLAPKYIFGADADFAAHRSILGVKLSERRARTAARARKLIDIRERRFIDLFSHDEMEC